MVEPPTAVTQDLDSTQRSSEAIARYNAAMRRTRARYLAVLTLVVAAVLAVVVVAYERGEVSHVSYHPASRPAPSVTPAATAGELTRRWTRTDRAALGTPFDGGTVVTYDTHTVRGRDASTGTPTWSYNRSDRTICAVLQDSGVTVAVYRRSGSCDEVSAFTTSTGRRAWTRTLDSDGAQFDGPATFQVYQGEVVFASRTSVYATAISSGVDYWSFKRASCVIGSVVLGSAGAVIAMNCAQPYCPGQKFCRSGPQLLLRPASNPGGVSQADQDANPDYIVWDVANSRGWVPALAGSTVAAIDPAANTVVLLGPAKGAVTGTLQLRAAAGSAGQGPVAASTGETALLWYRGSLYAFGANATSFLWSAAAANPPTVSAATGTSTSSRILVAGGTTTVAALDDATGRTTAQYRISAQSAAGLAYPLGAGILLAATTTSVYR